MGGETGPGDHSSLHLFCATGACRLSISSVQLMQRVAKRVTHADAYATWLGCVCDIRCHMWTCMVPLYPSLSFTIRRLVRDSVVTAGVTACTHMTCTSLIPRSPSQYASRCRSRKEKSAELKLTADNWCLPFRECPSGLRERFVARLKAARRLVDYAPLRAARRLHP